MERSDGSVIMHVVQGDSDALITAAPSAEQHGSRRWVPRAQAAGIVVGAVLVLTMSSLAYVRWSHETASGTKASGDADEHVVALWDGNWNPGWDANKVRCAQYVCDCSWAVANPQGNCYKVRCAQYVCDCSWAVANPQGNCYKVDFPRTKCWSCCCSRIAPELYRQAIAYRYRFRSAARDDFIDHYHSGDFGGLRDDDDGRWGGRHYDNRYSGDRDSDLYDDDDDDRHHHEHYDDQ
jgi:hypothetical protein